MGPEHLRVDTGRNYQNSIFVRTVQLGKEIAFVCAPCNNSIRVSGDLTFSAGSFGDLHLTRSRTALHFGQRVKTCDMWERPFGRQFFSDKSR